MKKLLLGALAVSLFSTLSMQAQQITCSDGRFAGEIFSNYTLTSDITYGNNPQGMGALKLDVYEPTGDVYTSRPLIILAHGGSFITGSKTDDPAVTESCKRFAKMGYVTASINYSTGFDQLPPDSQSAARTVYRVAREMKAAIRFFRKDAATTNTYKINPNIIIIGGNSAGAILSLHTAYLDQYSELPAGIDTTTAGGLEGNEFGNAGYSSDVYAVVNMAGAIGDTAWMINNIDIPVVSAHGDDDNTVPYGSETITLAGFPIMPVDGSGTIDVFTTNRGMIADLLTFPGDDHCPWNSNATKMTQMINHNRDFLYELICVNASINESDKVSMNLYPNPASEMVTVTLSETHGVVNYKLMDMNGRVILSGNKNADNGAITISTESVANGVYTVQVTSGGVNKSAKLVINK